MPSAYVRPAIGKRDDSHDLLSDAKRPHEGSLRLARECPGCRCIEPDVTLILSLSRVSTHQTPRSRLQKLVDRFASMLSGNLFRLAGPKGINLKVENPASYNFNPKVISADPNAPALLSDVWFHVYVSVHSLHHPPLSPENAQGDDVDLSTFPQEQNVH